MAKPDAARLVNSARIRRGLTWHQIASEIDAPVVWTTAALLGQHPMTKDQATHACGLLGLDEAVAESLQLQPSRGTDPALMADPTIYRFVEALSVYGPALKELIHEEFGDGIMSAINLQRRVCSASGSRRGPRRHHLRRQVPGLQVVRHIATGTSWPQGARLVGLHRSGWASLLVPA